MGRKDDGELPGLAAAAFDVFLTTDRNLSYQQNVRTFAIAIIVLIATSNRVEDMRPLVPQIPATLTIDPGSIESRITERTRAVMPVHIYGMPCDMDPIMAIARKHRVAVIEDARPGSRSTGEASAGRSASWVASVFRTRSTCRRARVALSPATGTI